MHAVSPTAVNAIYFNPAISPQWPSDKRNSSPAPAAAFADALPDTPPSPYLSVANSANDPYGFLSDSATAALAQLLGGTALYQSGNQSGTGPCTMPNWNQIRLSDGTLIGAGAAQHNIDLVGLDRYKEQLAALQTENAACGYSDPALNTPEAERYAGVQAALAPGLDPQALSDVSQFAPARQASVPAVVEADDAPAAEPDIIAYAMRAFADAAQRLGIEK